MTKRHPAIILAAGKGKRLGNLTVNLPKPLTQIHGVTIIDNLIQKLSEHNIEDIVVVTGYLSDVLQKHLLSVHRHAHLLFVENTDYNTTNNIYSLWLAKEYMDHGFYLFEADIFCDGSLIGDLTLSSHKNIIVVDTYQEGMDGTVVELTPDEIVKEMYLKRHQGKGFSFYQKYKTVNFYKLSSYYAKKYFIPKMDEHIARNDVNVYYEQIIKEDIDDGHLFFALMTNHNRWWEIDTVEDLKKARILFDEKR